MHWISFNTKNSELILITGNPFHIKKSKVSHGFFTNHTYNDIYKLVRQYVQSNAQGIAH
jgi:hypothetical protein